MPRGPRRTAHKPRFRELSKGRIDGRRSGAPLSVGASPHFVHQGEPGLRPVSEKPEEQRPKKPRGEEPHPKGAAAATQSRPFVVHPGRTLRSVRAGGSLLEDLLDPLGFGPKILRVILQVLRRRVAQETPRSPHRRPGPTASTTSASSHPLATAPAIVAHCNHCISNDILCISMFRDPTGARTRATSRLGAKEGIPVVRPSPHARDAGSDRRSDSPSNGLLSHRGSTHRRIQGPGWASRSGRARESLRTQEEPGRNPPGIPHP